MEENKNVNQFESENSSPQKESVFIKCDGCGSNMSFDPLTQTLKCGHCGKQVDFKKNQSVAEFCLEEALQKAPKWNEETTMYCCENCGANFSVSNVEVSVICPYCSTTHIVKREDLAGVKPTAVYPFLIDNLSALDLSKKWAKRRIFAPTKFKKNLVESNLHGIYMPFFTFDSDTYSDYEGRLGERRTRTVRDSKGKTRTETYIVWHHVQGTFAKLFDDVSISAGGISQNELDKLQPFKKETLCVYENKFLSGFTARHYSRDIKDCWADAKEVIDKQLRQDILHYYGYDVIDYLNVSTVHNSVKYKYVLLPIYRLNYRYNKKDYPVLVNGNNGKVTGKSPISPLRVLIAIILGVGLAIGLYFALMHSGVLEELFSSVDNLLSIKI